MAQFRRFSRAVGISAMQKSLAIAPIYPKQLIWARDLAKCASCAPSASSTRAHPPGWPMESRAAAATTRWNSSEDSQRIRCNGKTERTSPIFPAAHMAGTLPGDALEKVAMRQSTAGFPTRTNASAAPQRALASPSLSTLWSGHITGLPIDPAREIASSLRRMSPECRACTNSRTSPAGSGLSVSVAAFPPRCKGVFIPDY